MWEDHGKTRLVRAKTNGTWSVYLIQTYSRFGGWANTHNFIASDDNIAETYYEDWKKRDEVTIVKEG